MLSFYHKHSKRWKRIKTPKLENTTRKHNRQENKKITKQEKRKKGEKKKIGF
jgi:hypothetical protein